MRVLSENGNENGNHDSIKIVPAPPPPKEHVIPPSPGTPGTPGTPRTPKTPKTPKQRRKSTVERVSDLEARHSAQVAAYEKRIILLESAHKDRDDAHRMYAADQEMQREALAAVQKELKMLMSARLAVAETKSVEQEIEANEKVSNLEKKHEESMRLKREEVQNEEEKADKLVQERLSARKQRSGGGKPVPEKDLALEQTAVGKKKDEKKDEKTVVENSKKDEDEDDDDLSFFAD